MRGLARGRTSQSRRAAHAGKCRARRRQQRGAAPRTRSRARRAGLRIWSGAVALLRMLGGGGKRCAYLPRARRAAAGVAAVLVAAVAAAALLLATARAFTLALWEESRERTAAAADAYWECISEELADGGSDEADRASDTHPRPRYSAGLAARSDGALAVTHGYLYDHAARAPSWLDDTWLHGVGADELTWRRIGPSASAARPSARYGASFARASTHDSAVLFGGTDGGARFASGTTGYRPGNEFGDTWLLDLASGAWSQVDPLFGDPSPPARQLAATTGDCGGDGVCIFGGLGGERGRVALADLWRWDFARATWTLLWDGGDNSGGGKASPPARFASSMCAVSAGADAAEGGVSGDDAIELFLYGGAGGAAPRGTVHEDLWQFSLDAAAGSPGAWVRLRPAGASELGGGRAFATLTTIGAGGSVDGEFAAILFGGVNKTLPMQPNADAYALVRTRGRSRLRWVRIPTPPPDGSVAPWPVFRHSAARDQRGDLVVFGGESSRPYMYHNGVWALRAPLAGVLSLAREAYDAPRGGEL